MNTKTLITILALTVVLVLTVLFVPESASAAPPVWSSPACTAMVTGTRVLCGHQQMQCQVLWAYDMTRSQGMETGMRCQGGGFTRFLVTNTRGIVLLDSGDGVDTEAAVTDILPGEYPEITLTSRLPDGRTRTAIIYYNPQYGRYVSVFHSVGRFEIVRRADPDQVNVWIYTTNGVLLWSTYDQEFIQDGED